MNIEIAENMNGSWGMTGEDVINLLCYSIKHCNTITPKAIDGEDERDAMKEGQPKAD